ncbi:MAG: DUF4062 domain-containing protein [Clostridiales bacterium]|nr:DUF4062 domain-containing protein [Clostridiales bacterium]
MIKVFISSTFADMHAERDGIQLQVLPELRKKVEILGENFDFCDLRWGINTQDIDEEGRMGRILEVCFQEISKCSENDCETFMIVMLGERYGSGPDKGRIADVLKRMNDNSKRHKFTDEEVRDKSYTHLEVCFGPLAADDLFRRTIFMFRKPIDGAPERYHGNSEDSGKLFNLKEYIRKKSKQLNLNNVVDYSLTWAGAGSEGKVEGIDAFCGKLKEKLFQMMEPSLLKMSQLTAEQRATKRHWLYVHKKAGYFCGMDELLDQCKKSLSVASGNLILHGPSGIGKSCLLCKEAELKREEGVNVYPFICDNSGGCVTKTEIYIEWIAYLEKLLGSDGRVARINSLNDIKDKENEAYETVLQLFYMYDNNPNLPELFMFVDGADLINRDGEIGYDIPIIFNKYNKIKFIYSFQFDRDIFHSDHRTQYIAVTSENSNAEKMLRSNINAAGKELSTEIINKIVARHGNKSPKYLNLLLKRFSMLNADDFKEGTGLQSQRKLFTKIINESPDTEEEFARQLINLVAERTDASQINSAVSFLAAAEKGLRVADLQVLLTRENITWSNVNFYILINYLDEIFAERNDGTIDFIDSQLKESIKKEIDVGCNKRKIFEYLRTLPVNDPFRGTNIFYYTYYAGDKRFAIELIEKQYTYDASFLRALILSTYDKLGWLLTIIQSGKLYGMTERTIKFIIHQIWSNPIPGAYSLMHDLFESAVKFCADYPDEVSSSDIILSQARLAYYSHNYGKQYDPVKEGEKAVALFKRYDYNSPFEIIDFFNTYLIYIRDLVNNNFHEKACSCLKDIYDLIMYNYENGHLLPARIVALLWTYADLYKELYDSDIATTHIDSVHLFCLKLLASENSMQSLYGFQDKISATIKSFAKKEYISRFSDEELLKNALQNIPLMERIAEVIKNDSIYSALADVYRIYAEELLSVDCDIALQYSEMAYELFERLQKTGLKTQFYMQEIIKTINFLGQAYFLSERYKESADIFRKGIETINEYISRYEKPPALSFFDLSLEGVGQFVGLAEAYVKLGDHAEAYKCIDSPLFYLSNYKSDSYDYKIMANYSVRIFNILPDIWADKEITSSQVAECVCVVINICNSDWLREARLFGFSVPNGYIALEKIREGADICGKKGDYKAEIKLRKLCITETEKYYKKEDNKYGFKNEALDLYYSLAAAYEHNGDASEAYNVLLPHINLISNSCKELSGWEKKYTCINCYELLARIAETSNTNLSKKFYKKALGIVDSEVYPYGEFFLTVNYFGSYFKLVENLLEDCEYQLKLFDNYSQIGQCMACRELASNYITLGGIFQREGDYEKACEFYHNALDCCIDVREAGGNTDLDKWLFAMATNAIAVISEVKGEADSFKYFDEALLIFEQVHNIVKDGKCVPTIIGMDERMGVLLNRAFSKHNKESYTDESRKFDLIKALEYANNLQLLTGILKYKKLVKIISSYLNND